MTLADGDTGTQIVNTQLDGMTFSSFDGMDLGATTLSGGPVTLNSNGGAIAMTTLAGGSQDLTIAAGTGAGTTTVTGAVTALGDGTGAALTVENGVTGLVRFQNTVAGASGISAAGGTQSMRFDDNVTLADGDTGTQIVNTQLDGMTFSSFDGLNLGATTLSGGPVTLNSNGSAIAMTTLAGGNQDLTIAAGTGIGTTTVTGAVTALGDGTGAALTVENGVTGLVRFQSTVAGASGISASGGAQTLRFDDNVTLGNGSVGTQIVNTQLDGMTFSGFDGLNLGATTLSGGPVTLNSNGGAITMTTLAGGSQDLTIAAGTGAGTTTVTGAVTALGDGTGPALTVAAGVTGLVRFQSTVAGASGILASGGAQNLRFDDNVTLANGDTGTQIVNTQLDGMTFSSFDGLNLGATTLSGGPVALNSNGGNVTTTTVAGGSQNLTVTPGAGDVVFNGAVGTTALGTLTINSTAGNVTANSTITAASIAINNGNAVALTGGAVTAPGGFSSSGATFDNTGSPISTTNNNIGINHTGAVTLGAAMGVGTGTIDVDSTGDAINGGGTLTAAAIDLDASTGIGNLVALNMASPTINADSTNGNIDINNSIGGAVLFDSVTTGIGSIVIDQSGNSTANLDPVTTASGNVTVSSAGTLTATNVQATGSLTLNAGSIVLGTVTTGGAVSLNAPGGTINSGSFAGSTASINTGTIGLGAGVVSPNIGAGTLTMNLTGQIGGVSGNLTQGTIPIANRPPDGNIVAVGTVTIGPWDYLATAVDISAILASLATLSGAQQQLETLLDATTASEFFMTPPLEIYIDMAEKTEFDEAVEGAIDDDF